MLADTAMRPPLLDWWLGGDVQTFVSGDGGGMAEALNGCLRVVSTRTAIWMQLWVDAHHTTLTPPHAARGNSFCTAAAAHADLYARAREYRGELGPLLNDFGFAPFADHAKMVKQMFHAWPNRKRTPAYGGADVGSCGYGRRLHHAARTQRPSARPAGRPLLRHRTGAAHLHAAANMAAALRRARPR